MIDLLRTKYEIDMPGADLLLTNSYAELMDGVIEAKHIGVGVIDGMECEHLAFATPIPTGSYGSAPGTARFLANMSSPARLWLPRRNIASGSATGRRARRRPRQRSTSLPARARRRSHSINSSGSAISAARAPQHRRTLR